jgi:hypothetical protein
MPSAKILVIDNEPSILNLVTRSGPKAMATGRAVSFLSRSRLLDKSFAGGESSGGKLLSLLDRFDRADFAGYLAGQIEVAATGRRYGCGITLFCLQSR